MNYASIISLPDTVRGDRWPGIGAIGPVTFDGVPSAALLTRVRMHFVHSSGGVFRCDSEVAASPNAPIVIDDAADWTAHIDAIDTFLNRTGAWKWDMEFYSAGATAPLTLFRGEIQVHDDTTK
jgi:hypothetical protein